MHKAAFVSALALALTVSGSAFAQSPTSNPNPTSPNATTQPKADQQSTLTVQKVTQGLQTAGFTDVKVLEDAFLIQAKTKDGNPVLMTIGPSGMRALEVSNESPSQAPTTGQNAPTNSLNSAPGKSTSH
jgi:hypothetical protein